MMVSIYIIRPSCQRALRVPPLLFFMGAEDIAANLLLPILQNTSLRNVMQFMASTNVDSVALKVTPTIWKRCGMPARICGLSSIL